jgi:hypothetical protein
LKQVFHILRKDIRHLGIEVVLSIAVLIAYSAHEMYAFRVRSLMGARFWSIVLPVLLPITWWILIVRLIQGETLTGDRQFWITRPYEWKKLLAAKAIFILVFINVPGFLIGVIFLVKTGFNPAYYLIGLAWMQLYLVVVPLLPMVALATVTRNITQSLLAALAIVLYVAGMLALEAVRPESSLSPGFDADWIEGALVLVVSVLVIGLQYVRRKTNLSRALLAGTAGLIALIEFVAPYAANGERLFPRQAEGQPAALRALFDPKKPPVPDTPLDRDRNEPVEIAIPFVISGLPGNHAAVVDGVKLDLQAQDGFQWSSHWQSWGYYYPIFSAQADTESHWQETFKMERKVFDHLQQAPTKGRVSLALRIFRNGNALQITASAGEFAVPGVGRCWIDGDDFSDIGCYSPLQKPTVLMRTDPSASTCSQSRGEEKLPSARGVLFAWEWGSGPGPDYGIDPIDYFKFSLSKYPLKAHICPGTPLLVTFPENIERTRIEFAINDLNVDDYRQIGVGFLTITPRTRGK